MHKSHLLPAMVIFLLPALARASGFQIPNQSVTAIGVAGAHIAHTPGPDAAYYNPANMSFATDSWKMETSLTSLYLPSIEYKDNRTSLFDGSSDSELFLLPQIHVSSNDINGFRLGFSFTSPYGLAKSWEQPYPAATSQEFSLTVLEASPTFSYLVFDNLSIGGGIRLIYGDGEVKNGVTAPPFSQLAPLDSLQRDVEGDDTEVGYSLAATFRPIPSWAVAVTYKSEVTLNLEGDAVLSAAAGNNRVAGYQGNGSLEVNLPAVFSVATSYTFEDLTVEITWNRTFWSSFENLDFEYDISFLGTTFDGFDRPVEKNWKDTDALRLGALYNVSDSFTTTLGFAVDQTPVPESTLGFELPDSDSYMYSAGVQYHHNDSLVVALSYMYQHNVSRTVNNEPVNGLPGIDGQFTDGGAHALTLGLIYEF